jgi:magnesium-transporting ATPase (P-type)
MNFWLIYLIKGELVSADGKVINYLNFFVDEQILTGESRPVQKMWEMKFLEKLKR